MATSANTKKKCECDGTGWVSVPGTNMVKRCVCLEEGALKRKMGRLMEQSGLVGSLREKTFENYHPKTPKQKKARDEVMKDGSFFLIGLPGRGKTHLLAASVNAAMTQGVSVAFFSAPWLLKKVREDIMSEEKLQILENCCEIGYLVIDDLGKEKPSETVQEKLFMIFDRREVLGLRTSVTSNYDPETLAKERLDDAIVSRILGMCEVFYLDGTDYRKIMK
jgi:DNA replication protein DnaC